MECSAVGVLVGAHRDHGKRYVAHADEKLNRVSGTGSGPLAKASVLHRIRSVYIFLIS
jgi:hypothetical protein